MVQNQTEGVMMYLVALLLRESGLLQIQIGILEDLRSCQQNLVTKMILIKRNPCFFFFLLIVSLV